MGIGPPVIDQLLLEKSGRMEEGIDLEIAISKGFLSVQEAIYELEGISKKKAHCDENKVLLIDNGELADYGESRDVWGRWKKENWKKYRCKRLSGYL